MYQYFVATLKQMLAAEKVNSGIEREIVAIVLKFLDGESTGQSDASLHRLLIEPRVLLQLRLYFMYLQKMCLPRELIFDTRSSLHANTATGNKSATSSSLFLKSWAQTSQNEVDELIQQMRSVGSLANLEAELKVIQGLGNQSVLKYLAEPTKYFGIIPSSTVICHTQPL